MTRLFFIVFVCGLFNCACNDGNRSQKFIAAHGSDDFSAFKDYSAFIRSWEERGKNACVMILNDHDTGTCSLPYAVIIDIETRKIIEIRNDKDKQNFRCKLDTSWSKKLAIKLIDYKATFISVDSNDNVFISLKYEEQPPELIHFSHKRFITDKYKDYRPVKNGWYERMD